MAIEAELPDGRILEFPDGTDPRVVQATVKRVLGVKEGGGFGSVGQLLRGIPAGGIGLLEQGAVGASALLPDDWEPTVRRGIKSVAEAARAPFAEAPGKEDTVLRKLGESVGSYGAMVPLALAGPLGLAGAAGLGVAAGAGEARTRAEAGGATDAERASATAFGAGIGATEMLPVTRFLGRIGAAGPGIVNTLKRALVTGGEEGLQEAAANVAQNLVERGIYNPAKGVFADTGEALGYGAGTGALVSALTDVVLGSRRSASVAPQAAPPAAGPTPPAPPTPPALGGPPPPAPSTPPPAPAALPAPTPPVTVASMTAPAAPAVPVPVTSAAEPTAAAPTPPVTTASEMALPEATVEEAEAAPEVAGDVVTPEMLAQAGMSLNPRSAKEISVARWLEKNALGRPIPEVQALVQAQPDLLKGPGTRARILRELTTVTPAPFEGDTRERSVEPGVSEPADVVVGGSEPSVGVPEAGIGERGDVVPAPGAGAPAGSGVGAAGAPAAAGTAPADTASAPINIQNDANGVWTAKTPDQTVTTNGPQQRINFANPAANNGIASIFTDNNEIVLKHSNGKSIEVKLNPGKTVANIIQDGEVLASFYENYGSLNENYRRQDKSVRPLQDLDAALRGIPGVAAAIKKMAAGVSTANTDTMVADDFIQPFIGSLFDRGPLDALLQARRDAVENQFSNTSDNQNNTKASSAPVAPRPAPVLVRATEVLGTMLDPAKTSIETERALQPYMRLMEANNAPAGAFPRYLAFDLWSGSKFDRQSGQITEPKFQPKTEFGITAAQSQTVFDALTPEAQQQVLDNAQAMYRAEQRANATNTEQTKAQERKRAETPTLDIDSLDLTDAEKEQLAAYGIDRRPTVTEVAGGRKVSGIRYQDATEGGEVLLSPEALAEVQADQLPDALNELAKSTQNPAYAVLARRLMQLLGNTNIVLVDDLRNAEGKPANGAASASGNTIWLDRDRGMNEETLLHESVHAATERIIAMPANKRTAQQNVAVRELNELWAAARADADITLSSDAQNSLSEFVTEALTNPKLVEQLKAKPWTLKNAWESFKRSVLKALGVKFPSNMYDAAMASMDTIFSASPAIPPGGTVTRSLTPSASAKTPSLKSAAEAFDPKLIADNATPGFKSREKLVEMRIDDFLALADKVTPGEGGKLANTRKLLQEGKKFDSLPFLNVDFNNRVDGHEGRHRALALKEAGYETMPILLRMGGLRWSEQSDPKRFDYEKDWPATLQAQKGAADPGLTVPFPVSREDAAKPYSVETPARFQSAPPPPGGQPAQQPQTVQQMLASMRNQPVQQRTVRAAIAGAFGGPGQGPAGANNQYVVNTAAKIRTRISDKAATVFDALNDAVTRGMISEMDSKRTQVGFKQAEAADQLLPEFLRRGAIARDTIGGWLAKSIPGIRPPVEVFGIIENWGKSQGLTMADAWDDAARLMESARQYEFRKHNQNARPGDPVMPQSMSDAQINMLYPAYMADPVLQDAKKVLDEARFRLIDQMVAVGRISRDMAKEWKAAAHYIPFDRLSDEALGRYEAAFRRQRRTGTGLSALGALPTLVDSSWTDRPVGNALENYFGTLGWMTQQVVRTDALNKTLKQLETIGQATRSGRSQPTGKPFAKTYRSGQPFYYTVPTVYHAFAFNAQVPPLPGFLRVFGTISRVLRTSITALPTFTAAQLPQDIQRAILYSGVQNPAAVTAKALANFKELSKHALKGTLSTATSELSASGVVGDVDFRANDPARSLLEEFGYSSPTLLKSKTAGKILHRLNEISRASDIAIRKAIYDQTMLETQGDRLLALQRAREIINFRSTGAGDPLNILPAMIQTIPFFNAYIQGTDVLYRGLTGKGAVSGLARQQALKQFYTIAGALTAASTAYALMMAGDDEYENMALDKRDRTWVLGGGVGIPVPSEIGMLFKAIPERVVDAMTKYGTPDQAAGMTAITSWFRAAAMEYGGRVVPIPSAARPVLEAWTNYSMRTGRELEGVYQEGLLPSYRTTGTTSEFAKEVARFASNVLKLEISPIKIDNTLNGYFGTTAALSLATMDALVSDRADRPLHRLVGVTPFAYDPVGTRRIGEFYDLREKVVQAQNTMNALIQNNPTAVPAFIEDNKELLIVYKSINATLKQLQETRGYKNWLDTPDAARRHSGEERLRMKQEAQKWERDIVSWVRQVQTDLKI